MMSDNGRCEFKNHHPLVSMEMHLKQAEMSACCSHPKGADKPGSLKLVIREK